jgi:hypothetical protein
MKRAGSVSRVCWAIWACTWCRAGCAAATCAASLVQIQKAAGQQVILTKCLASVVSAQLRPQRRVAIASRQSS